jgi:hypothetical protein
MIVAGLTQGQASVIDNGGEDVVELVSDTACQSANAAQLLRLKKLLPQLVGLGSWGHHVLTDHEGAS